MEHINDYYKDEDLIDGYIYDIKVVSGMHDGFEGVAQYKAWSNSFETDDISVSVNFAYAIKQHSDGQ